MLFNIILHKWGMVLNALGFSITISLLKEKLGNINSAKNYWPITLNPVISKLFEYCIFDKLNDYLTATDLQFGFKKRFRCAHAHYVLRQLVVDLSAHMSVSGVCKRWDGVRSIGAGIIHARVRKRTWHSHPEKNSNSTKSAWSFEL